MATGGTFTADMLRLIEKEFEKRPRFTDLMISPKWKDDLLKVPTPRAAIDNPIHQGGLAYSSIPYQVVDIPPEEVIDWSGCRSPSRAKRRHARGIPQRLKVSYRERAFMFDRDALLGFGREFDRRAVKILYGQ